jgi:hypothetical protein
VRFCAGDNMFQVSFNDPGTYWCFKHLVYHRDQVDWHPMRCLDANALLDALLEFQIPGEVPLGMRGMGPVYVSFCFLSACYNSPHTVHFRNRCLDHKQIASTTSTASSASIDVVIKQEEVEQSLNLAVDPTPLSSSDTTSDLHPLTHAPTAEHAVQPPDETRLGPFLHHNIPDLTYKEEEIQLGLRIRAYPTLRLPDSFISCLTIYISHFARLTCPDDSLSLYDHLRPSTMIILDDIVTISTTTIYGHPSLDDHLRWFSLFLTVVRNLIYISHMS